MRTEQENRDTGKNDLLTDKGPVSVLWSEDEKPVCINVGDLHFSDRPPAARAESVPEWFKAQRRYIRLLGKLHKAFPEIPIICSGDVVHKWDSTAELINFLLESFNQYDIHIHSICGQHDIPNHEYSQISRSAYWTLCEAGYIFNMHPEQQLYLHFCGKNDNDPKLTVYPFPWDTKLGPPVGNTKGTGVKLAVLHKYTWWRGHRHAGVKDSDPGHITESMEQLDGKYAWFDAYHSGDNHSGFLGKIGKQWFNNGTFMRRRTNERLYRPRVAVLTDKAKFYQYYLDVRFDKWRIHDLVTFVELDDMDEVIAVMEELDDMGLNYIDAVKVYMRQKMVRKPVAKAVLLALMDRDT